MNLTTISKKLKIPQKSPNPHPKAKADVS